VCDKDSISLCQGWVKENDFQVSSKRIPNLKNKRAIQIWKRIYEKKRKNSPK